MDKAAAKNVYHFTLAIFLTNGILHAVKLTDAHFLIATPLQAISRITVFQILYLIDNALLWLWAIKLYNQDVDSERDIGASFEERKARVIAYFGPVCLLFIFEDGFSLYWEHFETNNVLGYLLNEFQAWNGLSIIVALILLAVMIVAAIVVAISRRDWFVGIVWVALLRALRFYLPIAGLLLVGIPVLTFSVSGGNEDIAPSAPSKNSIPVQSATPAQSAAPAEGAIPPARSIAPIQSAAPAQTPAKGDYEQAVADHTQPIEVGPLALADFNQWSKLDPKSAYATLWLDIIDKRGNLPSHLADATKQIDMTKWPAPIVRLYLGQLMAAAVLISADDPDPNTKRGHVCEANFFIGELMLQRGKKDEAVQRFRLAAADCPKDFVQYSAANAELKALGIAQISVVQ